MLDPAPTSSYRILFQLSAAVHWPAEGCIHQISWSCESQTWSNSVLWGTNQFLNSWVDWLVTARWLPLSVWHLEGQAQRTQPILKLQLGNLCLCFHRLLRKKKLKLPVFCGLGWETDTLSPSSIFYRPNNSQTQDLKNSRGLFLLIGEVSKKNSPKEKTTTF